ncbi:DoxX family protein [Mucilaginibacter sp. cycad4]|uniref:DoxX family protein n=1 Tax=Mucilaginibacter sp. cycad4 TaxID=3342096 RepID=UPI002AAB3788|nr:DoxX family protein [Mucilaginibacter gossypii]WPU97812.1 DoxX family protein [Mucilaginibacter gossypii]
MKNKKLQYGFLKGFITFFMLFSAYYSFSHPKDLQMLGFPDYFRIELVIAKVIGAFVLLLSQTPLRVKEWIYAGFIITMVSALIAHISTHDEIGKIIFVSVDLVLVTLSIRYVSGKDYEKSSNAEAKAIQ